MISKTVIILLIVLAGVYVGLGMMLYLRQNAIIYYPTDQDFDKCRNFADARRLDLDGTRAYFKKKSDTLVVFYHGNAGSACERNYIKKIIEQAGHSYLIVEFAGYSADDRKPSQKLLFEDAENAAKFIEGENFQRVLLMGESLGSAIAARHANVGMFDAILLISPFESLSSVAQGAFPFYPAKWLVKEDYDNVEMLAGKDNIWILHGTNDKVIPIEHSKKLFGKLQGNNVQYHEVHGAGHNDLFEFENTTRVINRFLE